MHAEWGLRGNVRADMSSESYLHSGRSTPKSSVGLSSSAYGTSARSAAEPAAAAVRVGGHARQTSDLYDEDGFLLGSGQTSRRVRLFLFFPPP